MKFEPGGREILNPQPNPALALHSNWYPSGFVGAPPSRLIGATLLALPKPSVRGVAGARAPCGDRSDGFDRVSKRCSVPIHPSIRGAASAAAAPCATRQSLSVSQRCIASATERTHDMQRNSKALCTSWCRGRFFKYSPATDAWTTNVCMPTKRSTMAVERAGGFIYHIGGKERTLPAGAASTATAQEASSEVRSSEPFAFYLMGWRLPSLFGADALPPQPLRVNPFLQPPSARHHPSNALPENRVNAIFSLHSLSALPRLQKIEVFVPTCDASGAIENGVASPCTAALPSGSSCQPKCANGFVLSGLRRCGDGPVSSHP